MSNNQLNQPEPDKSLSFKFWGVRGSIASPGPDTQKYGGNTSCVEICAGGECLILDGGTGLRRLGQQLTSKYKSVNAHIFLSHLHWDHIQGIPFFMPAFIPNNRITFYGERKGESSLKEILENQMCSPNFPVPLSVMKGVLGFHELSEHDSLQLSNDLMVTTAPMNHPNGCLGIRVDFAGRSIVYNTDTEHDPNGTLDQNVVTLAQDADVLIYDSMYTEEEYNAGRIGWGHSTYRAAIKVAQAANVKRLYFYHHDPEHDDKFLDAKLLEMREFTRDMPFEVFMAREGDHSIV